MIPIKILVVDDEPDLLMNLEAALRAEHYIVSTATNGKEAVERALAERPDLVIMDGMMPEMDGFAACRLIKKNPATENMHIIFLTAKDLPRDRIEGLDSGAIDYITKPFQYEELFARLRSFHRVYNYQLKLAAMVDFASSINQLDIEKLVQAIETNLTNVIRVELFSLFLYDEANRRLRLIANNHPHFAEMRGLEISIDNTPLMRDVLEQRRIIHVAEFSKSRYLTGRKGAYADDYAIGVPLMMGDRLIGVMNLNGNSYGFFDKPDFTFIRLAADHISSSISNALYFKKVQEMAVTDALTGVYNRRHLFEQLAAEWERFHRYGSVFALLMIDIDFFKKINDTYGHPCGDMILSEVAAVLKSHLRVVDTVARYGGEEFVILLPETTRTEAAQVAERIRHDVETRSFAWDNTAIRATISLGVEDAGADGVKELADILKAADGKLYRAKENGRNRVIS